MMKSVFLLLLSIMVLGSVSGFSILGAPAPRLSDTSLAASRAANKKISRAKWCEARGISDGTTVSATAAAVEEVTTTLDEEKDDSEADSEETAAAAAAAVEEAGDDASKEAESSEE